MGYNENFVDAYRKYISKGWYSSSISNAKLEQWCNNFKTINKEDSFNPKICAHFLLNSLIFYQDKQLEAIILSIINKIKSELNQNKESLIKRRLTEKELKNIWEKYKSESYIVAAAAPEDTAGSAHHAARLWRNTSGIDTGAINNLKTQITEKGKKHIFFVDDFIGTGSTMYTFFSKEHFSTENIYGFKCVKNIIKEFEQNVDFNVAVFAICDSGKTRLSQEFPNLNFYYGDLYNKEYDLIDDECVLYDTFLKDKTSIIDYIMKKKNDFDTNKYELNLPIAFNHGCPNNSLSLYYKQSPNWVNLLLESHPKEN